MIPNDSDPVLLVQGTRNEDTTSNYLEGRMIHLDCSDSMVNFYMDLMSSGYPGMGESLNFAASRDSLYYHIDSSYHIDSKEPYIGERRVNVARKRRDRAANRRARHARHR